MSWRQSPTVYAILYSITVTPSGDLYPTSITFGALTTSYAQDQISTQGDTFPSGRVMNFSDMPCGPQNLRVDLDGKPYRPIILPPPGILGQMGDNYSSCVLEPVIDPSYALIAADRVNLPILPVSPSDHPMQRRSPATAHMIPQTPAKTSEPT